jgi:molybdopterin-guanine dinucleotide biosynthesis protein A
MTPSEPKPPEGETAPTPVGVVGYCLAGGRSQRMGRDKALLSWGGKTLLGHGLLRLREATGRAAAVLCGPEPRYQDQGAPVFPDVVPEAGALGGILTGLERLPADAGFGLFLAVDIPLVPAALLRRLVERARVGVDAVVVLSPSGPEPLCAVYGRTCLEPIRQNVEARQFKVTDFWTALTVHSLQPAALREFGDPAQLFLNVNDAADYDALKSRE